MGSEGAMESEPPEVHQWRMLREAAGADVTIIDLYELVARPRGLAPHDLPLAERVALARSVMPDVWPGFETTGGSSRLGDRIEIVAYDDDWPRRYDWWHDMLSRSLGSVAQRIEHVGSTAIPGLPAKPIIDIQVSVADLADEPAYVNRIEAVGLQLRSRDDLHRFFRQPAGTPRVVHVHVCAVGSPWERDHLLFRDHLRAEPDARAAYAAVKYQAVSRWADDGWAYTDAKGEVIRGLIAAARRDRAR